MVLHSCLLDAGQLRYLAQRAPVAVHEHDGYPLPLGQGSQRPRQAGLEPVLGPAGSVPQDREAPSPAAALSDPEQVTGQVRDIPQPLPVLPGPGERLGGRVPPLLEPVGRDERAAQFRLVLPENASNA
jgi:hypothetical protein